MIKNIIVTQPLGPITLSHLSNLISNQLRKPPLSMGMSDLLFTISSLAATCTRQASRAARRLRASPSLAKFGLAKKKKKAAIVVSSILSRGASTVPFFDKRRAESSADGDDESSRGDDEFDDDDGVWRRTILMGEKCQPLDFSGAIHYDCHGRQLAECPMPRSPLRSGMASFAYHAAETDTAASRSSSTL